VTIAEDSSAPAAVHSATTSGTTASFSPPANSLLVVMVAVDGTAGTATTVAVSDSGSHTWTLKKRQNTTTSSAPVVGGSAEVWECQLTTAPGSITVTASWSTNGAAGGNVVTKVLTGAATDQSTAATGGTGGGSVAPTATLTPTQVGSHIYGACLDYATNASLTANSNSTLIDQFLDVSNGDTWAAFKGSADTTSLTSTAYGFTNANSAFNTAAVEILAATSAPAMVFLRGGHARGSLPLRNPVQARQRQVMVPAPQAATVPRQARVRAPAIRAPLWYRRGLDQRGTTVPVTPVAAPWVPLARVRAAAIRLPVWLRRRGTVAPVASVATPTQPAFLPALVRRMTHLARRGWRATAKPPTHPPTPWPAATPRRPRGYRPARRQSVTVPSAQPAPWLVPAIRRTVRTLLLRRGRSTVPPAGQVVAAPGWPPTTARRPARLAAARRARLAAPVPAPVAAPWLVLAIRRALRMLPPRRARSTAAATPAQTAVAPSWPPVATRRPVRLAPTRHGRLAAQVPAARQPFVPGQVRRRGGLRARAARLVGVVLQAIAGPASPPPGADLRSDSGATAMLTADQASTTLSSTGTGSVAVIGRDAAAADFASFDAGGAQLKGDTG
jgi:hypothetical protein